MVVLKHLPRIENISTGKHCEIRLGLCYVHIGNVWGSPAPRRFLNHAKKIQGFHSTPPASLIRVSSETQNRGFSTSSLQTTQG